ncbi:MULTISPECIES: hypothetical protein [Amycolatopsis]|uniref:hypothetical protein n=1 Tax=Amycolatopsis TaxID=1813 RepID=UPI000B8B3337|nr:MULTISPECIES: hypothetical protein [Amycolatopsis]OXM74041.1 hypothetical protein CF166_06845 [Amycolatopsis sp. KNN50.9b]
MRLHRSRRLVLWEYDCVDRFAASAAEVGWLSAGELPAEPSTGTPRRSSWQLTTGVFVTLFQAPERQLAYVAVLSMLGREAAAHFLHLPEASLELAGLDVWTDQELIGAVSAASDPGEHATALIRAGLGAPAEIAEPWARAFFAAAEHPSEEVRAAGIEAIMHAGWPRFAELLRAMAERDPSRDIRELAQRSASVLEARTPAGP